MPRYRFTVVMERDEDGMCEPVVNLVEGRRKKKRGL